MTTKYEKFENEYNPNKYNVVELNEFIRYYTKSINRKMLNLERKGLVNTGMYNTALFMIEDYNLTSNKNNNRISTKFTKSMYNNQKYAIAKQLSEINDRINLTKYKRINNKFSKLKVNFAEDSILFDNNINDYEEYKKHIFNKLPQEIFKTYNYKEIEELVDIAFEEDVNSDSLNKMLDDYINNYVDENGAFYDLRENLLAFTRINGLVNLDD